MKKTILLLMLANVLFICKPTFSQYNHEITPVKYLSADKSSNDQFTYEEAAMNEEAITNEMEKTNDMDQSNFNPFRNLSSANETIDKLSGSDFKIYTTGNEAIAGSQNVVLCITLNKPATSDYMVPLDFSGSSAVNGIDFAKIPDYVIFRKGEQNQCMVINPTTDSQKTADGLLKIRARTSENTYSDLEIKIKNFEPLHAEVGKEISVKKGEAVTLVPAAKGGVAPYKYEWNNNLGNSKSLTVNPIDNSTYSVRIVDSKGEMTNASFNVYVKSQTEVSEGKEKE